MNKELEEQYFIWLRNQIAHPKEGVKTYDRLFELLHEHEFVWTVPGDKHRAADGMELRTDFLRETSFSSDPDWAYAPCTLLEFFVAFSRRASSQTDDPIAQWFWEFMYNLGLDKFYYGAKMTEDQVKEIFEKFVWRQYLPSGQEGGICPLYKSVPQDQRKVEIWYQFFYYLEDQDRAL